MAELTPLPCPICGAKLKTKITFRKETVFDHPANGCKDEGKRVRSYAVADWNRKVANEMVENSVRFRLERGKMFRSCEDKATEYMDMPDGLRLIFRENKYVGWYLPGEAGDGND